MYLKLKRIHIVIAMIIFTIITVVNIAVSNSYILGMIIPIIYILFMSLVVINLLKKQEVNDDENKRIAQEIKSSIENNILDSIYPAVVINSEGKLFWYNKIFKELYPNYSLKDNKIVAVVRGLDINKIIKCNRENSQKIIIDKVKYDVYGKAIITEAGEEYYLVNFNDTSNLKMDTIQCIMLIEIDNLKELEIYINTEEKPVLLAKIQKKVNDYAASIGAMVKKYDHDKFILTILESKIESIVSDKFGVLEITSDIVLKDNLDITLSVGIGKGGESPFDNQELANKAIDLALGRGGDQIVIKSENNTEFFGGNTKALEKTSKVRVRVIAHALRELIYESSRVFIVGHKNIDMDCFGAAMGIASVVKGYEVKCNIVLNNDTNAIDTFLSDIKSREEYKNLIVDNTYAMNNIDDKTLIIVTDVHSEQYVGNIDLLNKCDRVVVIDHHRKSEDYIKNAILTYLEVYASSTSELITELIQYMSDKPSIASVEANGLLAGIVMDTKNFTFKTGVRTFEAAAFLKKMGADPIEVKKLFNNNLESYIARFEIIKSAEIEQGIAISACPDNISEIVFAAQGADELLNIVGIESSFVFVKVKNKVYLSSRSSGNINVQIIMEALGGGGHRTMAGTQFADMSIDEAKRILKKTLKEYFIKEKGDE